VIWPPNIENAPPGAGSIVAAAPENAANCFESSSAGGQVDFLMQRCAQFVRPGAGRLDHRLRCLAPTHRAGGDAAEGGDRKSRDDLSSRRPGDSFGCVIALVHAILLGATFVPHDGLACAPVRAPDGVRPLGG